MRKTRWALLPLLLVGCGNVGESSLAPLPPSTLTRNDGGIPGVRSDAARPIDGGGVPAEVQITILAPVDGAILKAASSPEVRAIVTAALPGDAGPLGDQIETVDYSLVRADDKNARALVSGPLFGPAANSEFATRTDLTTLETGLYVLAVTAVTRNGGVSVATVGVLVDAGPTLRIVSPKNGGTYKGSVAVQVQIDSALFAPTAEPIEATVGGSPIALTAAGADGLYEGLVLFEAYNPPLVDEQRLTVGARNSLGTRNQAEVKFVVDVRGPTFSDTTPLPGEVVGGVMRVRAKIEDPSGILGPSVIAVIADLANDVNFTLELRPEVGSPGYYSALFDTAKFPRCRVGSNDLCVVLPNLSFRASDILGNDSSMAYDFAVDHMPPIFDLDPPADMRLMKFDEEARQYVCSWAFDPLGNWSRPGDMPNQGCMAPQTFDLRALIEDDSNRGYDLKVGPIAGIDAATTSMYVLADTSQPLVVDTDGDTYCDAINPLLVPTTSPPVTSNQVLTVRLAPVPPTGSGDFTPDPTLNDPLVQVSYPYCNIGKDDKAPLPLCGAQTIPIALGYPTALDPQAAVWTIEPLTQGEPWCLGGQFDTLTNQIPDKRWACFAAAGADRNGNKGVSAPLRLWVVYTRDEYWLQAQTSGERVVDHLGATCPAPPVTAGPAPDCRGTYDPATKLVSNIPCNPRGFPNSRVRWQGSPAEGAAASN
ncbi:MAG: hypothetical protein JXP73_12290 [Deltaproteobacteria bacterium]|nr:hypothetical protein [Deltaproteobacteria bacterium]